MASCVLRRNSVHAAAEPSPGVARTMGQLARQAHPPRQARRILRLPVQGLAGGWGCGGVRGWRESVQSPHTAAWSRRRPPPTAVALSCDASAVAQGLGRSRGSSRCRPAAVNAAPRNHPLCVVAERRPVCEAAIGPLSSSTDIPGGDVPGLSLPPGPPSPGPRAVGLRATGG